MHIYHIYINFISDIRGYHPNLIPEDDGIQNLTTDTHDAVSPVCEAVAGTEGKGLRHYYIYNGALFT